MPAAIDDNPDISEYIGRGDVNIIYVKNGNILSFNGSHNLTFNSNSRERLFLVVLSSQK
jgi:phospholipase A1